MSAPVMSHQIAEGIQSTTQALFLQLNYLRTTIEAFELAADADKERRLYWPNLMNALRRVMPSLELEEEVEEAVCAAWSALRAETAAPAVLATARKRRALAEEAGS